MFSHIVPTCSLTAVTPTVMGITLAGTVTTGILETRGTDKKKGKALGLPLAIGAGNEARTRDLNLGKVALYQLSYSRVGRCMSSTPADWRCDPESNWANRICNPGHNRFAIAPQKTRLHDTKIMGKPNKLSQEFGAGNEARTRDLNLGKVALYQLSYSRKKRSPHYRDIRPRVNKFGWIILHSASKRLPRQLFAIGPRISV
jgi:hypothetical protein